MPKTNHTNENPNDEGSYDFQYNLNDPDHKQKILNFEKELAGRNFKNYCMDTGLTTKGHPNYPDDTPIFQKDGGILPFEIARRKMKALESLRRLRFYARKEEHLAMLGGDECPDKPDTGRRCEYCYPFRPSEVTTKINVAADFASDLAKNQAKDVDTEMIEKVKGLFDDPEGSPLVDGDEEEAEEIFANEEDPEDPYGYDRPKIDPKEIPF